MVCVEVIEELSRPASDKVTSNERARVKVGPLPPAKPPLTPVEPRHVRTHPDRHAVFHQLSGDEDAPYEAGVEHKGRQEGRPAERAAENLAKARARYPRLPLRV